jgi:hypothetical protein
MPWPDNSGLEPAAQGRRLEVREPWIWTLDDDASDLLGPTPTIADKRLLRYAENSGSLVVSAPFGSHATLWFWSPANQPGQSDWPEGPYDVQLWILVANANIDVRLTSLFRCDGFGAPIELYTPAGADLNCGTTGSKRWQGITTAPIIQPTSGDRLRAGFTFTNNGAKGTQEVTIGFGNPARDYVEVPILMGNPQIVWNGNTLAFPGPLTAYDPDIEADGDLAFSGGRVAAGILHSLGDVVEIELANFEDAQFEADLRAWWAWAAQKKQYAFAFDSADVVNLALNGAAAAGQKDIPLADTSSVVVGRSYLLREAAGPEEEIIQVASVTVNVKAVAQNNLKFGYITGDKFRAIDYFPKMVSLDTKHRPWRQHFTTWSLTHRMAEDRG